MFTFDCSKNPLTAPSMIPTMNPSKVDSIVSIDEPTRFLHNKQVVMLFSKTDVGFASDGCISHTGVCKNSNWSMATKL